jgi:hypothetical protein
MFYFTEIADWFNFKRMQTDSILDRWVEVSNYDHGVMIVASTTKAFTTFGSGFVDVLRLGDGIKEGSLSGLGVDALRLVAIFPVGKVASLFRSAKGLTLAKVIVDTGGPNCFWVASAKAFGQIGHKFNGKLYASVDDIAKALGMDMNKLWPIPNLSAGMSYLQQLGAKVGVVKNVASATEVEKMVPFDGSVVMIAVNVIRNGKVAGGHAIYAFRTVFGQIRYMDRTVGELSKKAYTSIKEIAPLYGASALTPYQAAVLHNVFVKTVAHDIPRLVMPILGVIATEKNQ